MRNRDFSSMTRHYWPKYGRVRDRESLLAPRKRFVVLVLNCFTERVLCKLGICLPAWPRHGRENEDGAYFDNKNCDFGPVQPPCQEEEEQVVVGWGVLGLH